MVAYPPCVLPQPERFPLEVLLKSFKVQYDKKDSNSYESDKESLGSNESKLNHKKTEAVVEKTVDTVEEV